MHMFRQTSGERRKLLIKQIDQQYKRVATENESKTVAGIWTLMLVDVTTFQVYNQKC